MRSSPLAAELVVVGFILQLFILHLTGNLNKIWIYFSTTEGMSIVPIVVILIFTMSYLVGFFLSVISEFSTSKIYKYFENKFLQSKSASSYEMSDLRYDLYSTAPPHVINRIEYHRSSIRLSRCILLSCFILLTLSIYNKDFILSVLFLILGAVTMFAFAQRIKWFTNAVYSSWRSAKRNSIKIDGAAQPRITTLSSSEKPNANINKKICIIAGGSASRDISIKFTEMKHEVTRIVPVWDNGGSSKVIREQLGVLPIGDIRQSLMTLAHAENRINPVVRLCNWRLPNQDNEVLLKRHFETLCSGQHPLFNDIEGMTKSVVLSYLNTFKSSIGDQFDLKNGSVGNFVLAGAFLAHERNIDAAIHAFKQLCGIQGNTFPISNGNHWHLNAILEDGQEVLGEQNITTIDRTINDSRIQSVTLENSEGEPLTISESTVNAIRNADVIIIGPGSFFTSIIPHFQFSELVQELINSNAPKFWIANIKRSEETHKMSFLDQVNTLEKTVKKATNSKVKLREIITHIITNTSGSKNFRIGGDYSYFSFDELEKMAKKTKIEILHHNIEDPWRRGEHSPQLTCDLIMASAFN